MESLLLKPAHKIKNTEMDHKQPPGKQLDNLFTEIAQADGKASVVPV